jgi:hypothetical protein
LASVTAADSPPSAGSLFVPVSSQSITSTSFPGSPQIFTLYQNQTATIPSQIKNSPVSDGGSNTLQVSSPIPQVQNVVSQPVPVGNADYSLQLTSGWNFISIPFPLSEGNNTASIFRGVNSRGHSIYRYDTAPGWMKVRNTDYLPPLEGFWIYSAGPVQIPLFSKNMNPFSSTSRNLQGGWNTIGISSANPQSINSTFRSIADNWLFLVPFNATVQKNSDPCINGWKGDFGDEYEMVPGKGYWVYMKSPGTFSSSVPSDDILFSGTVDYKVIEQGWTITLPGTVTGKLSPDSGNLQIFSNDAVIKYSGKSWPISMNVEAILKK